MKTQEVQAKPWRAILLEAAQYIREHGLAKWAMYQKDGSACVLGAMRIVAIESSTADIRSHAVKQLSKFLAFSDAPTYPRNDIATWNDLPSRTKQQAIDALEGAARMSDED